MSPIIINEADFVTAEANVATTDLSLYLNMSKGIMDLQFTILPLASQ